MTAPALSTLITDMSSESTLIAYASLDQDTLEALLAVAPTRVVDLDAAAPGNLVGGPVDTVVVIAAAAIDLRRIASMAACLPKAKCVRIVVAVAPRASTLPVPRLTEPSGNDALRELVISREADGWILKASFEKHVSAGHVLAAVARAIGGGVIEHVPTTGVALPAQVRHIGIRAIQVLWSNGRKELAVGRVPPT